MLGGVFAAPPAVAPPYRKRGVGGFALGVGGRVGGIGGDWVG